MATGFYNIPKLNNEPINEYQPESGELKKLLDTYNNMYDTIIDIPFYIDGKEVRTGKTSSIHPPHDIKHSVGQYHNVEKKHVKLAIEGCLKAKKSWSQTSWEHRAAIFLKAAELLAGPYRDKMNASTMISKSR